MKRLTIVVLPILILALILGATGCDGDGETDAVEGASPTPIRTPAPTPTSIRTPTHTPSPTESAFEWINEGALRGGYIDLALVRSDKDLVKMYEGFANDTSAQEEFRDFGIDQSQIDYIVYQEMDYEIATLILGRFDLDNIREKLGELGFTSGIHENTEFWEGNYTKYEATGFAFMPDKLIWGHAESVRSFVSTVKGLKGSFYDIPETKGVLDKIPDWAIIVVELTFDVLGDYGIPNTDVAAWAMAKKDRYMLNAAEVFRCADAKTASQLCTYLGSSDDVHVTCEGEFIIVEREAPIEPST
ncbi:MAG: hypothetical protein JSW38_00050 [Dehalococcoidia bacterium]|nr:MAG: hypothetical protein JSW38_00050 [Dehalococcoidia bacterium]